MVHKVYNELIIKSNFRSIVYNSIRLSNSNFSKHFSAHIYLEKFYIKLSYTFTF